MSENLGLLRDKNFMLYFAGVTLSEVGVRGTLAINLYHVFILTGSTALVGLVGLFQVIALVLLAPLGGAIADRLDRRSLVQLMQGISLVVSAALAVATYFDVVTLWHIYLSVLLNTAAATFDSPARRALIPGIVPRQQLVKAFALVTPGRELATLIGPALGGLLVAVGGPELMYAVDAITYLVLIGALAAVRVAPLDQPPLRPSLRKSIAEGFGFVRHRPIIWKLMGLDIVATMFGAYRVVLPALAEDVLNSGPTGYGLLSASVPAGALVGAWILYRMIDRVAPGPIVLWSVAGYGAACIALAQSPALGLALAAGCAVGAADAMQASIRQAVVQMDTPDAIRGRVSSIQQLAARGGPAMGSVTIGGLAGLLGPVGALTLGAAVPIAAAGAGALSNFGRDIRGYEMSAN